MTTVPAAAISLQQGEPPRESKRIPELDGLRGLAIFVVILCHYIADGPVGPRHSLAARAGEVLGLGTVGVDLFFILSGFLIGGILLNSRLSPRYYRTFYLRRFFRIIPIYYGWLILFGLFMLAAKKWGVAGGAEFTTVTPYWAYFVFLQNYFQGSTAIQAYWLIPLWSLAVEEQFYLLAPPVVRMLSPERLVKILTGVLVFSLLLRIFLASFYGASHDYWGINAATDWMPCRADDLALGMLVATLWTNPQSRRRLQERVNLSHAGLFACAASLLAVSYWIMKPDSFMTATLGRTVIGFFFMFLMIISLTDKEGWLARIFRWSPLRELGKVSYCVYIIHRAVNWGLHRVVLHGDPRFDSWPAIGVTVLSFAVTMILAELSWRYFENPLIHRGHRYSY
jgi:peptidoglycan/LPS O-acetylase OafA/YrhL